jgi:phasin family protein
MPHDRVQNQMQPLQESNMATETNPFEDVTKLFQQFKVPGVDMEAIAESRQKDMQALVDANKAAQEAMQALVRKQTEVLTQAMEEIQGSAKALAAGGNVASDPAKQTELVRDAYQKALADMKELADMARKSQTDALAIISQRAMQSLEEMKKMMQPKYQRELPPRHPSTIVRAQFMLMVCRGRLIVEVHPRPGSSRTLSTPPLDSMLRLATESPNPILDPFAPV